MPSRAEPEFLSIRAVVTHRRISVRRSIEVQLQELLQIRLDNLAGVDENDLLQVHWEEDVEEQDLVRPDVALLLRPCTGPRWPLASNQLVLKAILEREVGEEFLRVLSIINVPGQSGDLKHTRK